MPVNQILNNPTQTDITSRYEVQRQQRQQLQQETQQREASERNNPSSEDIRVTLSREGNAPTMRRTTNTAGVETQRMVQETRNIESQLALQAYQNAQRTAENTRPEDIRQRQINRIVG